jgi:PAS domain S-box-containing protein
MFNLDRHFFPVFDRLNPATAYPGSYDLGLVATSVAIAMLAAFIALSISGRIVAARTRRARHAWATAGAISMGGGIWSMHFVGMLAFSLPCGITYDLPGTVLSMSPGMLASGVALATLSKADKPRLSRLFVAAILIGAGIVAMHYSGMAAMRPQALLQYNPGLVAISIVVAVALAFVSLSIRFEFHRLQTSQTAATIIAALVMGGAIAGMHYTAMQASIFFPLPNAPTYSMALSPTLLALLITIFTALIAITTLLATFAGRQSDLALSLRDEISRRMRTEEDLRRSDAYLAEAQRLSHTGSWAFDIATRKPIHSSEEHYRLFGFNPAERMPVWKDWVQRLHPEDRERTIETIERAIRERTDFDVDYRVVHPDGATKYIHTLGRLILNPSSDLIEFVGTSIDMTERKWAETEAREIERRYREVQMELLHANRVATMGQLTASIAHEVNQPIAGVVSSGGAALRWLSTETPNLEAAQRAIERVIRDGKRAGDVISRIRDLIKKAPPRKDNLDINEAIREVIVLTRGEAVKNGISVHTQLTEGLPFIQGDRVQLQQVMLNLIINAIEAMSSVCERSRELSIHTSTAESGAILVTVEDSGPGLDPTDPERVFEAFYTTKSHGMGMGLSICRAIIEAYGGQLRATAKPHGASFQFTVPPRRDTSAVLQKSTLG